MHRLASLVTLLLALPAAALDIEFVAVRDPGNPCDTQAQGCFGAVGYDYAVSKYEITNAEYVQFLNEVANQVDAFELYNPSMPGIDFPLVPPGNERFYVLQPGWENKAVVYVSFYDALRFANWLHNGQPEGFQDATTTEDGAYAITPTGIADDSIVRRFAAAFFVPSEDEWYKAAYYDPTLPGYNDFPAGDDAGTTCAVPSSLPNIANCDLAVGAQTEVGAYTGSPSPYGTFDQGGNVWEWNEATSGSGRGLRGGAWDGFDGSELGSHIRTDADPLAHESGNTGFRVARVVPEPGRVLLVLTGALVLSAAARRPAKAR